MLVDMPHRIENKLKLSNPIMKIVFRPRISPSFACIVRNPFIVSFIQSIRFGPIRATAPVYVNRYAVTIQSRSSKPPNALVIETNEVLTIVVSTVDRKSAIHILLPHRVSILFDYILGWCEPSYPPVKTRSLHPER